MIENLKTIVRGSLTEFVRHVHGRGPSRGLAPDGGSAGRRDVFHVSFDPQTESVVEVVLGAVAVVHNREPVELSPLGDAVEPDALDKLVSQSSNERSGVNEIRFVYEGLDINIDSDGDVWLKRE